MVKVHELEGSILNVLNKEDEHEVETDLLELLNYDNFELIKILKSNRFMIYYLTLLAKAEDKESIKS